MSLFDQKSLQRFGKKQRGRNSIPKGGGGRVPEYTNGGRNKLCWISARSDKWFGGHLNKISWSLRPFRLAKVKSCAPLVPSRVCLAFLASHIQAMGGVVQNQICLQTGNHQDLSRPRYCHVTVTSVTIAERHGRPVAASENGGTTCDPDQN